MAKVEWFEPESARVAKFNEELFSSITTKYPVYDMCIIGGYGEDEVNPVTQYKHLKDFISSREAIIFDGGVFAKTGGSSSGANCSKIERKPAKVLEEMQEYAGSEETRAEVTEEFNLLLKRVAAKPGYVVVSYGVENDLSAIGIHKDDYKTLHKFKTFEETGDYDTWAYWTPKGRKICGNGKMP